MTPKQCRKDYTYWGEVCYYCMRSYTSARFDKYTISEICWHSMLHWNMMNVRDALIVEMQFCYRRNKAVRQRSLLLVVVEQS